MILKKLVIRNFSRFKDKVEFDLDVKKKEQNIILIEAMNGVGKTSFLNAVNACFFGMTPAEFKKYLNYQARDEENDLTIDLELQYKDSNFNECRIIRQYTTTDFNKAPSSSFEFELNGAKQDISDEDWRTEYINRNFPKEISKFFFFDGEQIQGLVDTDDPAKLKTAIEKILGIETVRNLKDDLLTLKADLLKKVNASSSETKQQVELLKLEDKEKEKNLIEKYISEMQDDLDIAKKERYEVNRKFVELAKSGLTKEKLDEQNENIQARSKLEAEIQKLDEVIDEFVAEYLGFFIFDRSFDELEGILRQSKESQQNISIGSKKTQIAENLLTKLFVPKCIHDGTPLRTDMLKIVQDKICEAIDEATNSNVRAPLDVSKNFDEIRLAQGLEMIKKSSEFNIDDLIDKRKLLTVQIENINKEIREIEREISITDGEINIQELELKRDELDGKITNITSSINLEVGKKEKLNTELRNIEKSIEYLTEDIEISQEQRKYLELLSKLNDVFDTYFNRLTKSKKDLLERKTLEMFLQLDHSGNYKEIRISENYQLDLIDKNDAPAENLNSGHKQILMTALIWGLEKSTGLKKSPEYNLPIIIDTPLARLDDQHRKNMLDYYFPSAGFQVIILSQPAEIRDEDKQRHTFKSHLRDNSFLKMTFDKTSFQTEVEKCSLIN